MPRLSQVRTALVAAAAGVLCGCSSSATPQSTALDSIAPATSPSVPSPVSEPPASTTAATESTVTLTTVLFEGSTGSIPLGTPTAHPDYQYSTIVGDLAGSAGATTADFNGDGIEDIAYNSFGSIVVAESKVSASTLTILYQTGNPASVLRQTVVSPDDGYYFLNEVWTGDLDGDGDVDIIAPSGFFICSSLESTGDCGALVWWENTGNAAGLAAWAERPIVPYGSKRFYHRPAVADIDGDGTLDIVATGESFGDALTVWFKGTGDGFDPEPNEIGMGGGSYPTVTDIDGDGDLDVASGQYFQVPESVVWFENVGGATGVLPAFERHTITDQIGKTIQLSLVPDLDGPGQAGWVVSNHTNTSNPAAPESGVYRLRPGTDPRQPWSAELMSAGIVSRPSVGTAFQAAPGVFGWGDLDGDGDTDLAVSGDGDARLFILSQSEPGQFATAVLEESLAQAGSMHVGDLNDDGSPEILAAGFENSELRIYFRQ